MQALFGRSTTLTHITNRGGATSANQTAPMDGTLLNYPERLMKLKLPTLSYIRKIGDMIEMYKLISGKYDVGQTNIVRLWKDMAVRTSERGNLLKIYPERVNHTLRKNYFVIRSVPLWNDLPESVVTAKTLDVFKNRLDKFWESQDILYNDFKANILATGSHVRNKLERFMCESGEEDDRDGP
jgi:hypothetical protein